MVDVKDSVRQAVEPINDLMLTHRRDLVLQATDIASEVIGEEVSVATLVKASGDAELSRPTRLMAKRAVRFLEAVGREDSPIVARVGEEGLYDTAEAMILFGGSEARILSLIEAEDLSPRQIAGLYSLRQEIGDMTEVLPSFNSLFLSLQNIGVKPAEVADDTGEVLAALDDSGHFVSTVGEKAKAGFTFRPDKVAKQLVKASVVIDPEEVGDFFPDEYREEYDED